MSGQNVNTTIDVILNTIITSEAFLIVISGVLIFTAQKLISELWIAPIIAFKKCLAKLETLLIRYEFLCGYEYGSNNSANDADVDYFRQELKSIVSELIGTFSALPFFEKWMLLIRRVNIQQTKPELLILSARISTKKDVMEEIPRSERAIANIRTYLKFKVFKIDYSKVI
ncbi:MAG: hypothetical protein Q8R36_04440 [bacterium]|nr:hypothetical protein [bacterium]